MPENATVMDEVASTPEDLREKLVNLAAALAEVENKKKAAVKAYNDEIKDLKEELQMTLSLIKEGEDHE